ncbi:MAG: glycosyltransferase [Kiritimatiellales bacterium]
MKLPLISVCVPAYNHEQYVVQMLNSVLAQDYPQKELIIINDGSKDSTAREIEAWIAVNSTKIPVFYQDRENRGLVRTFNDLVQAAHGEYMALTASDDYLLPSSLSRRLNYLQSHPEKKAVFGDFQVIDGDGNSVYQSGLTELHKGRKENFNDAELLKHEMLHRFCVAGPVLMIERDALSSIGAYDESLMYDDWDMYLRLAGLGVLGFIDEPVAAYRWHGSNTCRNKVKNLRACQYERKVLENNRRFFDGEDLDYINKRIRTRRRKEIEFLIRHGYKNLLRSLGAGG